MKTIMRHVWGVTGFRYTGLSVSPQNWGGFDFQATQGNQKVNRKPESPQNWGSKSMLLGEESDIVNVLGGLTDALEGMRPMKVK